MNTNWKYVKTGYWGIRERRYQTDGDNFITNFTVYTMHGRDGGYTISVINLQIGEYLRHR
jgi:hypothetical protein